MMCEEELLDHFAGLAMPVLLIQRKALGNGRSESFESIATVSYDIAQAMIDRRRVILAAKQDSFT